MDSKSEKIVLTDIVFPNERSPLAPQVLGKFPKVDMFVSKDHVIKNIGMVSYQDQFYLVTPAVKSIIAKRVMRGKLLAVAHGVRIDLLFLKVDASLISINANNAVEEAMVYGWCRIVGGSGHTYTVVDSEKKHEIPVLRDVMSLINESSLSEDVLNSIEHPVVQAIHEEIRREDSK